MLDVLMSFWLVLFDGQDTLYLDFTDGYVDSITASFNLTYRVPSVPMLRELRDTLYSLNEKLPPVYTPLGDTVTLQDVVDRLGKSRLYDIEEIMLLASIAQYHGIAYEIYCLVRYNPRTGDVMPFDLTPLYGTYMYGCYPLLYADGSVISPRKFFTVGLIQDVARFPDGMLKMDAPSLLYQLRGFRTALVRALKVGNAIPDSLYFEVLK